MDQFRNGNNSPVLKLIGMIRKWFIMHIQAEEELIISYFLENIDSMPKWQPKSNDESSLAGSSVELF